MAENVLVIEDDAGIRLALRLALEDEGYAVAEAESAEHGLERFADGQVDVVLLDLMLPGMDGFECCRRLRQDSDVPIVILSAKRDSHDVVAGLEAGADDYVTKPFVVKEVTARLRALRRRLQRAGAPSDVLGMETLTVGDLALEPDQGSARLRGEPVHLTKTEFRLLAELAAEAGRVFSREQLLQRVWEHDYFADARIVDVHVRRLRAKIEDAPASPERLVTVRGFGYKLQP